MHSISETRNLTPPLSENRTIYRCRNRPVRRLNTRPVRLPYRRCGLLPPLGTLPSRTPCNPLPPAQVMSNSATYRCLQSITPTASISRHRSRCQHPTVRAGHLRPLGLPHPSKNRATMDRPIRPPCRKRCNRNHNTHRQTPSPLRLLQNLPNRLRRHRPPMPSHQLSRLRQTCSPNQSRNSRLNLSTNRRHSRPNRFTLCPRHRRCQPKNNRQNPTASRRTRIPTQTVRFHPSSRRDLLMSCPSHNQ